MNYENKPGLPEDCYDIVIGFLQQHYGMRLGKRDISVCHRQIIPSDRRKYGRNYIAPIYCKFVNRFNAQYILDDRNCLRNCKNKFGQPLYVKENLTYKNKLIWDSAQSDLGSYQFKYIKNWKIFVKKDPGAKPIQIRDSGDLAGLIENVKVVNPQNKLGLDGTELVPVDVEIQNAVVLPHSNQPA